MNDFNMANTILDTFSVKYYFPQLLFLFNCSLQNQQIFFVQLRNQN